MKKSEKIIVITGTFNPMNLDEVIQIKRAKVQGDWVIVGVHSDRYIKTFLEQQLKETYETRRAKILALKSVDEVFSFDDSDGTAINLLSKVKMAYPGAEIFFVTADEGTTTIPEIAVKGIKFLNVKQP
jgi:bifunctional ADP-heptose synthase (sugar kinase/adenylyltransferase)